jgi:hypothetical protein
MSTRWRISASVAVLLGFALITGCDILGNRFASVKHHVTTSTVTQIANETSAQYFALVDEETKGSKHSIRSCMNNINLLSRHIRDDQENRGLQQWSLSLDNGAGAGSIDFPGLDDSLIRTSLLGTRIYFLGDSTTNNFHNWLYVLLKIHVEAPLNVTTLSDMHMSDANSMITSWPGCRVGKKNNAHPCTEDEQSNFSASHHLKYTAKRNVCANDTGLLSTMRDHEPQVIVANIGLWMLHFQARGRDIRGDCVVNTWIHYEQWLGNMLLMAEDVGAQALFFKTTNTICSEKFTGQYSKANKLYEMMDNETLLDCFNNLKFTQKADALPTSDFLSDEDIHSYCTNATFNNRGSAHLNQRLHNFVESNRNTTSIVLHVFDDNTIKSCDYTDRGDARHYHPLNLVRIRLLAHLISCLE